jgi:CHAT domain-containing protein
VRFGKFPRHFLVLILVLTYLVCYARPLSVFSQSQQNDAEAIRNLVGRLFDLYKQKDLDKLIACWSEKSPFLAENKKALQEDFDAYETISVKGFDIRDRKVDGEKATLRVSVEVAITRAHLVKPVEKIEKKSKTIDLVNEGGIWKVWRFTASEEELAAVIVTKKTEEERKAAMAEEPELMTSDFAVALARHSTSDPVYKIGYKHALAINQLSYEIAKRSGDQFAIANALLGAGYIYGWLGAPERSAELALENFQKSLKVGEEYGFKEIIAKSLIRSAVVYSVLVGEFTKAEEYYQKALKLAEELKDQQMIFQAMNNLGVINREKGNYVKALELWMKCLKMTESQLQSGGDWYRFARALQNIGGTFKVQNNFEQALAYNQRAIEAANKAITMGDPHAKLVIGTALASIGDVYLDQGNDSLAMDYYQKGLKLADEFGNPILTAKDRFVFTIKVRIGNAFVAKKDLVQAVPIFEEAFQLAEKAKDKTQMAYPLMRLSDVYLLLGDYHKALAFAERAGSEAQQIGFKTNLFKTRVIEAKAHQKLGQLEKAQLALDSSIDLIEELQKQSAGGELDRQRSFEDSVVIYLAMIDLQVDQKRFTEGFSYAQRAKGRILLELLQNGRVRIDKSASATERQREQQLSKKIVSLNREITDEKLKSQPDKKHLAAIEEQLRKARLEFEAFQTALYITRPELKVHRGEIRPVTYDDVAGVIPDTKTAVMDFVVTDDNVHLFVLSKEASAEPIMNTYTIKIERKSLAEKVERYRRRMENRDYDFQALSQELYALLIKPALKHLEGKTNLIISPDNVLWDLPFQTLLSAKLRYLIEDAAISYTPSLSVLREMQLASKRKQAPAKSSLLALGNPALGNRSRELVKLVKMDAELQPLPEAAAQVRALEGLYGKTRSRVLIGTAAREELVKEQSGQYRIVHLATHGILNDVSPMYSHVMLSQAAGKSEEDGLLEAWEMMNLDLNADLVVLAGCETARGRVGAGEGVIGMSWALFVAGCPRTVVSQWKVEATSTTDLMVEFHKKFKTRYGDTQRSVSTAESLRQAALRVMRNPEFVHPFYWGGFVVVGDGN